MSARKCPKCGNTEVWNQTGLWRLMNAAGCEKCGWRGVEADLEDKVRFNGGNYFEIEAIIKKREGKLWSCEMETECKDAPFIRIVAEWGNKYYLGVGEIIKINQHDQITIIKKEK